jgi:hypothetical protein
MHHSATSEMGIGNVSNQYSSLADYREAFENGVWDSPPAEIIDLRLPDTHICIGAWGEGYGIYWTDYVANEWWSWSPNLSTALCFVAAIQRCYEHDWAIGINVPVGQEFDGIANRFLSEVTA